MRSRPLIRLATGTALAGVLALVVGCASTDKTTGGVAIGEPIRVGVILPFSGSFAREGEEVKRGYELALADYAQSTTQRPIELIFGDASAPVDTIAEVDRLATREKVDIFIGTYASPASQAGSEAAARYGLPWYETHATTDTLTERKLELQTKERLFQARGFRSQFFFRKVVILVELFAPFHI